MNSFLSSDVAFRIRENFGTPCYVYDENTLRDNARGVLAFPHPFGLTARYAMKACPNASILRLFNSLGIHIDASSGFEAERAIAAGFGPEKISLSSQELPSNLKELVESGMSVNACSLHQLETFGKAFPGSRVGLRFNPGLGTGGTNRTNVGGPASSFGIWKETVSETKEIIARYNLDVFRIHTHVGSGGDPDIWVRAVMLSLDIVKQFESTTHLNIGGGHKVARIEGEKTTDLQLVGTPMKAAIEQFALETGRQLHLEVEPGTYFVANAGVLLASVQDLTSTGDDGYNFIKLDSGMTENVRPAMYGSQHDMRLIPSDSTVREEKPYMVVGHCCESGDILTPAPADPEALSPRPFPEAKIGDLFAINGSGAYCSSMSAKNYNSFPESPEVLIRSDGSLDLIRKRQDPVKVYENELKLDF